VSCARTGTADAIRAQEIASAINLNN